MFGMHDYIFLSLIDCGNPTPPINGNVTLAISGQTTLGSRAFQSCNTGYKMAVGMASIKCNPNGKWHPPITCLKGKY